MFLVLSVVKILFWISAMAMVHTYLLYPLTLRLFPRRFRRPPAIPDSDWPTIALLIPAYNEEAVIGAKIENALALRYDPSKLEIWVGSDGSTDRTDDIVRAFDDPRVKLVRLGGRSGKTGVLNRLVESSHGEILAISDANVRLENDSMRNLVRHFADKGVGCVCGGKYIEIPKGAKSVAAERLYGDFENRVRTRESEIGGMSGALGSLMAFRRTLYRPFPAGSTNDDTVPAIWAVLAGLRQVFDPEARAFEEAGRSITEEARRRVRIGSGNFQTLFRYTEILSPRYGITAYTYFSHKVLRWTSPFFMIVALAANLPLIHDPLYFGLFYAQIVFYCLAALGYLLDKTGLAVPVVTAIYHFVALNIALLQGFFLYRKGMRTSTWERTER